MWKFFDPNPHGTKNGDCAVRAICAATGKPWDEVYLDLCLGGLLHGDWGSNNAVWGNYLKGLGFKREVAPDGCTVNEFCEEHPHGTYILAISGHVVTAKDGCFMDTWDSGRCEPVYYWFKED